jgi:hypothetical protein
VQSRIIGTELYYLTRGKERIQAHRDSITAHMGRTFFEVGDRVEITGPSDLPGFSRWGSPQMTGRVGTVKGVDLVNYDGRTIQIEVDGAGEVVRFARDVRHLDKPPARVRAALESEA